MSCLVWMRAIPPLVALLPMHSRTLRTLGSSHIDVSSVGFGCWPIAGVSSLGVNDADSLATLHAALDSGINFIDTAFSYGFDGEADKLLAQVLKTRRSEVVVASKVGSHYDAHRTRVVDGRPETLIANAHLARQRLGIEQLDVLYLHEVDPQVPLAESAGAIAEIVRRGVARCAGVSNVDAQQLALFHAICPVVVVQPPFNMLQTDKVDALRELCLQHNIAIACYWVLMKGLLAGKLPRNHQFDPADRRLTYPIYQGQAWQRSQDLLDRLRQLAGDLECTVAQLVIAWTLAQPGITVALCGAKRPAQIQETAAAMHLQLSADVLAKIDAWRGTV
jgi:aryl-alcohol dehydrogenase-like predicted oxidoreductase